MMQAKYIPVTMETTSSTTTVFACFLNIFLNKKFSEKIKKNV